MGEVTVAASPPAIGPRERANTLLVLTACHTINDFYNLLLPPLLPAFYATMGLSHTQGGALQFLYTVVSAILQPTLGYVADRRSMRRQFMIGGFLIYALAALWFSTVTTYGGLLAGAVILGLGASIYHPQSATFLVYYFRENRGRAQGIHGIGNALGFILAPSVVGSLAYWYGWQTACIIVAFPALLGAALVWGGLREPAMAASAGIFAGVTRPLLLLTLLNGIMLGTQSGFVTHLPSFYSAQGYELVAAGVLTTLNAGSAMLAQPLGGALSDRFGRRNVIAVAMAGAGVFLAFFLASPFVWLAVIFSVVLGFWASLMPPVSMVYASELATGERTGTAVGIVWGMGTLIASVSPLGVGFMIDHYGFTAAYAILAVTSVTGSTLAFLLPARRKY